MVTMPRAVVRLSCTIMLMPNILLRGAAPYYINPILSTYQNLHSSRRPMSSFPTTTLPKVSIMKVEGNLMTTRSMTSDIETTEYPPVDVIRAEVQRRLNKIAKKISKERVKDIAASGEFVKKSSEAPIVSSSQLAKLLTTELELKNANKQLHEVTSTNDVAFRTIAPFVKKLRISRQSMTRKVAVGQLQQRANSSRLPYQVFSSADGIEIRAGRTAAENDELSCNPDHRDGDFWWMHVSGVAGSHVVICSTDDNLKKNHPETIADAAAIAAKKSKAATDGKVEVTLTRCRYVSKPRGAPAGMVTITSARASVVKISLNASASRLQRLTNNGTGAGAAGTIAVVARGA